jgi:LEA14-like dessication related protein
MKQQTLKPLTALLIVLCLSACASLTPEFDPPKVSLESFNSLPSESGTPRFEIKLRVANPNKQTLDIAGISYSVELLGKELISGVTNEVPVIEGYTEEVVTLEAGLQLFELVRLIAGLGNVDTEALDYRFAAKIDFNGFIPTQRIEETGQINLNSKGV